MHKWFNVKFLLFILTLKLDQDIIKMIAWECSSPENWNLSHFLLFFPWKPSVRMIVRPSLRYDIRWIVVDWSLFCIWNLVFIVWWRWGDLRSCKFHIKNISVTFESSNKMLWNQWTIAKITTGFWVRDIQSLHLNF